MRHWVLSGLFAAVALLVLIVDRNIDRALLYLIMSQVVLPGDER